MKAKVFAVLAVLLLVCIAGGAQVAKYETFIYTSSDLPREIQRANDAQDANGYLRYVRGDGETAKYKVQGVRRHAPSTTTSQPRNAAALSARGRALRCRP